MLAAVALGWTRARRGAMRALRTTAAWFRRVLTPVGWVAVVALVGGLGGAWRLGWAEAAAAGILSGVLLVVGVLFVVGRRRYDVELGMLDQRVVAGQPATGEVTVRNSARRVALPGRVDVPMGEEIAIVDVPLLRRGATHRATVPLPTDHRGVVPVGPVRTVRIDPLGLFRLESQWHEQHLLYVHPQVVDVPGAGAGLVRDLEGEPTRVLTDDDISFHALREYRPGDSPRHLHAKSTAKTGVAMVRQYEETRRSRVAVVLALETVEYAGDDELELAVSVAASLSVRALHEGRGLDVVVSEEQPEVARNTVRRAVRLPSNRPRAVLDALSGVRASVRMLGLREICELYAPRAGDVSVAFLVCGSTVPLRQIRSAALHLSFGVSVVVVVADTRAEPSVRNVGDLVVVTVAVLEDLRHVVGHRTQA